MKKNCCKSFPHIELFIISHGVLLALTISLFCLVEKEANSFGTDMLVAIVSLVITVLFFGFTIISGWNAIVIFDDQKVCQKRWLKKIEWKWEEICDITCRLPYPFSPSFAKYLPKIKLIHVNDGKTITFALWPALQKKFFELCTNETICKKLKDLIKEFDYWPEIGE